MISIRRAPASASLPALIFSLCALLLALPAVAFAAPVEGEEEPPLPQLTFEPGSYDFGLQQANSGNQATLQLRNDGTVAAPVNSLEINGDGTFAINGGGTSCYGSNLQPGQSCWVQVVFGPYDAAPYGAQLRAYSDRGTVFTADLSGEGGRPRLTTSVDPTNFGAVPVGSPGVTKSIDVTNTGNIAGGAFIAVIAGGAIGSFQLLDENCSGIPLSPGATCNLVVRFQPISTGAKTARLGLFGDSDGGTQITLTGVGFDPEPVGSGTSSSVTSVVSGPRRVGRVHRMPRRLRGLARRRVALSIRRAAH
jgi:hypothetical protein